MNTILSSILPARAMGIEIYMWNGSQIELAAPLAPNLNDKGTAFAGSIDSLLDLAGWSAITLALQDAGLEADVMIVKSESQYLKAVRADMNAEAEIPASEMKRVEEELNDGGRSRLAVESFLYAGGERCAVTYAYYAVFLKHG